MMAEGVEESRSKRRPPWNGADRARTSGGDPARKGADFRQVSAEAMDLDGSTGGGRERVRAEQTDGRQPITWSSVDWTATEAAVGRIQDRIFRAAQRRLLHRWCHHRHHQRVGYRAVEA